MKINKNHWTAKLYRMTYGTESELPKTICPYFWKLVLAFPLFIICQPLLLPTRLAKSYRNDIKSYGYISPIHDQFTIGVGLFMYFIGFWLSLVLIGMVKVWIPNHDEKWDQLATIGYIVLIVVLIILIIIGSLIVEERRRDARGKAIDELIKVGGYQAYLDSKYNQTKKKEKKPNIITEYMKGLVGKYCTRIDWKD